MPGRLQSQSYGKHSVRVSKVRRPRVAAANVEHHEFVEASVNIELQGAFDAAYTAADNTSIIATDTCKNTVYALAKDHSLDTIESFGVTIAEYFLTNFSHVENCRITLSEQVWTRISDSAHAFIANDKATPTATVSCQRGSQPIVQSGVKHVLIAKTTESGFTNFHESEFRTLADTEDRILATDMTAEWTYASGELEFAANRRSIFDALLAKFIDHYSNSVQETLYKMGQSALDSCSAITEITLTMPNKHHLLANLSPFDRENENEVFVVTDEPFGYITATIERA
ncbi:MAG: factor-independent urate hydroxylase [Planctomycetota bacterium]